MWGAEGRKAWRGKIKGKRVKEGKEGKEPGKSIFRYLFARKTLTNDFGILC